MGEWVGRGGGYRVAPPQETPGTLTGVSAFGPVGEGIFVAALRRPSSGGSDARYDAFKFYRQGQHPERKGNYIWNYQSWYM